MRWSDNDQTNWRYELERERERSWDNVTRHAEEGAQVESEASGGVTYDPETYEPNHPWPF